jgi:hypothetical protein
MKNIFFYDKDIKQQGAADFAGYRQGASAVVQQQ